jgi:acetyl esterase/lipase
MLLSILTYYYALLSIVPFLRPKNRSVGILLWAPKLFAGALSPIIGLICGLGAVLGLTRRDWKLAGAGILGVGLATKFITDIPTSQDQFVVAFGPDWQERAPIVRRPHLLQRRLSLLTNSLRESTLQQDLVYGQNPKSGKALLADLWQPQPGKPRTGLGVIYIHGGGWRIGYKDMGTRTFFQRLVGQGHVVSDIAYTLSPQADIPTMVTEINQAILWMKEKSNAFGVNPERIVLMGASAGGHLALLAAYTPNHPAFQPFPPDTSDTSVRGVVAYYPLVDFLTLPTHARELVNLSPNPIDKAAHAMMASLFMLKAEDLEREDNSDTEFLKRYMAEIVGGDPEEILETYRLLSPIHHVGPHCPPTLLLQGSDDVLVLASEVRRLHRKLQAAVIPVVMIEFPHTEHAFDLVLPQVSPVARAATSDVERFLALLA